MWVIRSLQAMKEPSLILFREGTKNFGMDIVWFAVRADKSLLHKGKVLYPEEVLGVWPLRLREKPVEFELPFSLTKKVSMWFYYKLRNFLSMFELPDEFATPQFWVDQLTKYMDFLEKNFVPIIKIARYTHLAYRGLPGVFMSHHNLQYYVEKRIVEELGLTKTKEV